MNGKGIGWVILVIVLFSVAAIVALAGCLDNVWGGEGSYYCCRYEERYTGCGGTGWSDWKSESESFNIDDYKEGWTPEKVCDKYTESHTKCDGGCCIFVEYRNNQLSGGSCS